MAEKRRKTEKLVLKRQQVEASQRQGMKVADVVRQINENGASTFHRLCGL